MTQLAVPFGVQCTVRPFGGSQRRSVVQREGMHSSSTLPGSRAASTLFRGARGRGACISRCRAVSTLSGSRAASTLSRGAAEGGRPFPGSVRSQPFRGAVQRRPVSGEPWKGGVPVQVPCGLDPFGKPCSVDPVEHGSAIQFVYTYPVEHWDSVLGIYLCTCCMFCTCVYLICWSRSGHSLLG